MIILYCQQKFNNKETFIRNICEVKLLYKKILNETDLNLLSRYIHDLGLNYVYFEEFILSIAWYSYQIQLQGNEKHLLDIIKYLKDLIGFYPRNRYLFFILLNTMKYLVKNTFYNFEADFKHFIDYLGLVMNEICIHFQENQYDILKEYYIKLEKEKFKYIMYNIIKNMDDQFVFCLTSSQELFLDPNSSEENKIFALVSMIYHFKQIGITSIQTKYLDILKNKYPDIYQIILKDYSFFI